jgi:hypothetical protein
MSGTNQKVLFDPSIRISRDRSNFLLAEHGRSIRKEGHPFSCRHSSANSAVLFLPPFPLSQSFSLSVQQEEALPILASKGDKGGANIQRQFF